MGGEGGDGTAHADAAALGEMAGRRDGGDGEERSAVGAGAGALEVEVGDQVLGAGEEVGARGGPEEGEGGEVGFCGGVDEGVGGYGRGLGGGR